MPDYRAWLANGLKKDGIDVDSVAGALNKHRSVVYKMLQGERKFHANELPTIAEAINEPVPVEDDPVTLQLKNTFVVSVSDYVADGVLRKTDGTAPKAAGAVVVFKDDDFPDAVVMGFRVSGDTFQRFGIFNGDDLVCVKFSDIGGFRHVNNGALVVVSTTSGGLIERTLRSVLKTRTHVVLQSLSMGEQTAPLTFKRTMRATDATHGVKLIAVVRSLHRNLA